MTAQLQMRRLYNFGWLIETREGEPRAIKRDDGLVFHVDVRLVETREQLASSKFGTCASSAIGHLVRTSLRPWPCYRADGWRSSHVRAYAERRRAPRVRHERRKEIARRNVWCRAPAEPRANPLDFAARVMARGTLQEMDDIERLFGRPALEAALDRASPGVVDPRSWNYWFLRFGRDLATPFRSDEWRLSGTVSEALVSGWEAEAAARGLRSDQPGFWDESEAWLQRRYQVAPAEIDCTDESTIDLT